MIPRARHTALAGTRGDAVLIRLAAPPVDNLANDELRTFLARTFGVAVRAVRLVAGDRSRTKRVAIDGVTIAHARERLSLRHS